MTLICNDFKYKCQEPCVLNQFDANFLPVGISRKIFLTVSVTMLVVSNIILALNRWSKPQKFGLILNKHAPKFTFSASKLHGYQSGSSKFNGLLHRSPKDTHIH